MTKKEAYRILLFEVGRSIRGAGMGFRATTEEHREKVRTAMRRVYKDVMGFEPTDSDLNNLAYQISIFRNESFLFYSNYNTINFD